MSLEKFRLILQSNSKYVRVVAEPWGTPGTIKPICKVEYFCSRMKYIMFTTQHWKRFKGKSKTSKKSSKKIYI